jgi:hypothetical protein
MILLLTILYTIIGIAVAFLTAMSLGMAAGKPKGYLGFVYEIGKSNSTLVFVLLAIVIIWPIHIPLVFLSN